jgi:hypothetical protein
MENPHVLAEKRILLSEEYSRLSEQESLIVKNKAVVWPEMRKNVKSVAEADRMWEMSTDGVDEQLIKIRQKAIEKELSAINSFLHTLENHAKGYY